MKSNFHLLFFLRKQKGYQGGPIAIDMRITVDGKRMFTGTTIIKMGRATLRNEKPLDKPLFRHAYKQRKHKSYSNIPHQVYI